MNIYFKKIDKNFTDLKVLETIYQEAFPKLDIIPFTAYLKLEKNGSVFCKAAYDNEKLIGYIIYLDFGKTIYIENFAVSKEFRGKGYGSKILNSLMQTYREKDPATLFLLDVEVPSEDASNLEQRKARISFYERLGYQLTHIKSDFMGIEYVVMTTMNPIDKDKLEKANAQADEFFKSCYPSN